MKQLFLYRLYSHSKFGFILAMVFIISYAALLFKKMDMTLFPLNNMFAYPAKDDSYLTSAYLLKINGSPVYSTHFPYWKKDFMESSLSEYAKYLQNGNRIYMHQYLETKPSIPGFIRENLLPRKEEVSQWPCWYAHFGGRVCISNASEELIKYKLSFSNGSPIIKDSMIIYKNK